MTSDRELPLPDSVRAVIELLTGDGHRAALVGPCVRALLAGRAVRDFEVVSSAPASRVLALFPRAIPIAPGDATIMVPTRDGPVDVTAFRQGPRIDDDLAHRDFTINAIAWQPSAEGESAFLDPTGGLGDLEVGRLRTVGDAQIRLQEDPVRALRAARLVAELPVEASPDLEAAMKRTGPAMGSVSAPRLRSEITLLLLAPRARAGLELLRRTGIEASLAPGVFADAARLVDRLPSDLPLRLAAWLRGTKVVKILARLRFFAPLIRDVESLLALHPVDLQLASNREPEIRRLLRRAGEANLERLFVLREAELSSGAVGEEEIREVRSRLASLRQDVERVRDAGQQALLRTRLAIGGREVMEILGIGPGPRVGRALRFLTEKVQQDPACNSETTLREILRAWNDAAV